MSTATMQVVLARLYTEPEFLARFLADPDATLLGFDLTAPERAAFAQIDRDHLTLAASSYAHKRAKRRPARAGRSKWLLQFIDRLRPF